MNVQLPVRQAILDRRTYEPPGEGRADKLRLDFNENTAGCSPAVKRAWRNSLPSSWRCTRVRPRDPAFGTAFQGETRRTAAHKWRR